MERIKKGVKWYEQLYIYCNYFGMRYLYRRMYHTAEAGFAGGFCSSRLFWHSGNLSAEFGSEHSGVFRKCGNQRSYGIDQRFVGAAGIFTALWVIIVLWIEKYKEASMVPLGNEFT